MWLIPKCAQTLRQQEVHTETLGCLTHDNVEELGTMHSNIRRSVWGEQEAE